MKRTILFLAAAIILGVAMPTMAQQKKTQVKRTTTTKSGTATKSTSTGSKNSASSETFVFNNGILGPIQAGKSIANVPKSFSGLYDKYIYEKKECADMDGEWTEDHYYFYKNGKKVIDVWTEDKKISAITLLPGSSFIKTSDGFYVGSSARDLFNKKRMEWATYYDGFTFASSKKMTYYINSGDLIGNVETPSRVTHIKANAKIAKIVYSVYVD